MMRLALATPERWEIQRRQANLSEDGPTYQEMKDYIEGSQYDFKAPRHTHIGLELSTVKQIIPLLARRNWNLCRAPANTGGFLTSDHPVYLSWIKPIPPPYSPGLGLGNTSVVFPLSRELCMVGEFDGNAGVSDLTFRGVAVANGATVWNAGERVYAPDEHCVFMPTVDSELPRQIDEAVLTDPREGSAPAAESSTALLPGPSE